jgi:uncharacterized membrane protein
LAERPPADPGGTVQSARALLTPMSSPTAEMLGFPGISRPRSMKPSGFAAATDTSIYFWPTVQMRPLRIR